MTKKEEQGRHVHGPCRLFSSAEHQSRGFDSNLAFHTCQHTWDPSLARRENGQGHANLSFKVEGLDCSISVAVDGKGSYLFTTQR